MWQPEQQQQTTTATATTTTTTTTTHNNTQQQTTTNNNKQQQTTTNNNKQQQTTTNNNKQQQHTTTNNNKQQQTTTNNNNSNSNTSFRSPPALLVTGPTLQLNEDLRALTLPIDVETDAECPQGMVTVGLGHGPFNLRFRGVFNQWFLLFFSWEWAGSSDPIEIEDRI